jgi:hypothetical protein
MGLHASGSRQRERRRLRAHITDAQPGARRREARKIGGEIDSQGEGKRRRMDGDARE